MSTQEIYEKIIYVYDIDVDNCIMTHYEWASLLSRALTYPDEFKKDLEDDYDMLKEERDDSLTRGNF